MPKVKVGDVNIYYEIHGTGEPLVLIQGLGEDSSGWSRIMPLLSRHYRVIAFDNRGVGQSDKPDVPYSIDIMANDLAGLLDAIGVQTAHVLGISMGGTIAQSFVLNHPDRVISLILGCTICGGPHAIGMEGTKNAVDPERLQTVPPEERARLRFLAIYGQEFIDRNPEFIQERLAYSVRNPPDPVGA